MASDRGWPSSDKSSAQIAQHVTIEPIREKQHGLSVLAHTAVRQVGTDAVDSATTSIITAASHAAKAGDVIRFTSGNLSGQEVKVLSKDTNTITLAESLSEAPAAADTFEILRHKYLKVAADGSLSTSQGPTQYVHDGVDTEVEYDSGTPANSRPLPVVQFTTGGAPFNAATAALQATGNTALAAIQAAVEILDNAVAGNEFQVDVVTSALPSGASTAAHQVTQNTALAAIQAAVEILDNAIAGSEMQVDVVSSALPTGAATEAKQDTIIGHVDGIETLLGAIDTSLNNIEAEDFATETTLAAASNKLPASLGQKAMAASLAVVVASDQSAVPTSQSVPTAETVKQAAVTVGTSAVRLTHDGSAPSATRRLLRFMPDQASTGRFFYGSSSVTSSGATRGCEIFPGQTEEILLDAGEYYIISDTAAQTVYIVEQE